MPLPESPPQEDAMVKKMEHVVVSTKEGMIHLEQPDPMLENYPIIIHPDQVPVLIKWLEEAREELSAEAQILG
jgi:hypothetical protein